MHKSNHGPMGTDVRWRHAGYEVGWTECGLRRSPGPRYWISRPDERDESFARAWTLAEARDLIEDDLRRRPRVLRFPDRW